MGEGDDETAILARCPDRGERVKRLADLFMAHRRRLRWMVQLRLSPALQGRIDPSDVLQESFLEVSRRLDEYLESPVMPLFVWLRRITGQKLAEIHRRHLGAKARDARREIRLACAPFPEATSAILASKLAAKGLSPSEGVLRDEASARLEKALERLSPLDREVIALRHSEELTNQEVAAVLGVDKSTASKRYFSAVEKLKSYLGDASGPSISGDVYGKPGR
jgi:RNA polymerase sigma-70 factor (ECF subfamily)